VFPVLRGCSVAGISIIGDGGAGEVEGAAVGGGDDLDCVGVGDVLGGAEDFEGGDFDVRLCEGAEEGGEVLGLEEGLVSLDVDVDVGGDELGYGVEAVGAAGEVGRGELEGEVVLAAEVGDFFGVGGDEDAVELGAGFCGFVDPGEHGFAGDDAEDLAREARGGETGGDDAEDDTEGGRGRGGRLLFGLGGIKYDWSCLCRNGHPLLIGCFHLARKYTQWAV